MAGRLLFVILMYSCHEIQVQALYPPTLTVNSPVITETDSVTLNCRAPSYISMSQCYFYTVGRESPKILSCMKTLTGSELLNMAHQSSPAEVKVKCFYTIKQGEVYPPSPHSDPSSITIHSDTSSITIHSQKPHMSVQPYDDDILFMCSLPGSANHDTKCNLYFGEESRPYVAAAIWPKKTSSTNQKLCQFTVPVDDLQRHLHFLQRSYASCDYSVGSDPNSLSPRSDEYSLTEIVKSESSMAYTRAPFTTTTDIVKSESSTASTRAMITDLIDRPGPPTTTVKPPADVEEKEPDVTLSMPTSTVTTGQTDSNLHTATPVPSTKQTTGVTAGRSSYTGSFISASLTPVRPASGLTPPKPGTYANSFPVTPPNSTSETWTWKLVVAAACFGGVVFLGLALLCIKRTERCSKKRTQANVPDDLMCMKNLDHGGLLPAGNDETYSVITAVPAADCPAGSEKLNRQASQNEDTDVYHVYSTIPEEPRPSALTDMVYSTLQAH